MGKMKDLTITIEELNNECNHMINLLNRLKFQRETLIDVIEGILTGRYSEQATQIALREAKRWEEQDTRRRDN